MKQRRGRRWFYTELEDGLGWWWVTWRLFERMSGVASTEDGARAAIDHFLKSPTSYTLR